MSTADRAGTGERIVTGLLAAVGVLNLAPGLLALRPDRLPQAYGVVPDAPALVLLLRHRAVLLGLVGAALTASAHDPGFRRPAILAAAVSKTSFLALAGKAPPTPELRRVARADALGLLGLVLAVALDHRRRPPGWQPVRARRTR